MKIPNKVKIVNSSRTEDRKFRFDEWEGYDPRKIDEHIVHKINEIIDFLYLLPELPNITPPLVQREGDRLEHQHFFVLTGHVGNRGFYKCTECSEIQQRLLPIGRD